MVGYRDISLPRHRFEIFPFGGTQHMNRFRRFLSKIRALYNADNPEDVAGGLRVLSSFAISHIAKGCDNTIYQKRAKARMHVYAAMPFGLIAF
jgi:hypothetical protein